MKKRREMKKGTLLGTLTARVRRWGMCLLLITGVTAGGALMQGCQGGAPRCSQPGQTHVYTGDNWKGQGTRDDKVLYCYEKKKSCEYCGQQEP